MNIHVSEDTYKRLQKATILSIKMGSQMYGLNNQSSDTDLLHIIATPTDWNHSLVWNHNNLQYKEDGVDHIFTTLQNFVRNILKGDSTINYECLYSEELKGSSLSFLFDMRFDFNNYSLLRAYLGFTKRDLKFFSQNYESKKLVHALRGVWTVKRIAENTYSNDIKSVDEPFFNHLKSIKDGQVSDKMVLIAEAKKTSLEMEDIRSKLNSDLNNGLINRIMNESSLEKLDQKLKLFCDTNEYSSRVVKNIEIPDIYKILNSDVSYSN